MRIEEVLQRNGNRVKARDGDVFYVRPKPHRGYPWELEIVRGDFQSVHINTDESYDGHVQITLCPAAIYKLYWKSVSNGYEADWRMLSSAEAKDQTSALGIAGIDDCFATFDEARAHRDRKTLQILQEEREKSLKRLELVDQEIEKNTTAVTVLDDLKKVAEE